MMLPPTEPLAALDAMGLAELVVAATLWMIVFVRLFQRRGAVALAPRRAARLWPTTGGGGSAAMTIGAVAIAVLVTLDPPAVAERFDIWIGSAHAAQLVQHLSSIVPLGTFLLIAEQHDSIAAAIRRHVRLTPVAMIVMVVAFALAPVHDSDADIGEWADFITFQAGELWVAVYWVAYGSILTHGLCLVALLARRYIALAGDARGGTALRLILLSCYMGWLYVITTTAVMIARVAGSNGPFVMNSVTILRGITFAIGLFVLAGVVWANSRVGAAVELVVAHTDLFRLTPLWADMITAVPSMVLSRRRARMHYRDIRLALYRTVIEIRDGYLELEPWYDPCVEQQVARIGGLAATHPLVVAATWEVARQRMLAGDEPTGDAAAGRVRGGETLRQEVRELRKAAHWHRRAKPVAATVLGDSLRTRHQPATQL